MDRFCGSDGILCNTVFHQRPYITADVYCSTVHVVGKLIGKKHIFPELSPHKSLEGCIGGVAGAALIGGLYAHFFVEAAFPDQIITWTIAFICAAGAVMSMVGDLAASAIKRNHNIKDYGKLIPGHGGIMDRFDSMTVTAPMTYFLAVRNNPELQVAALAAGKSVEQMEQQIREFHPLIAGMWSEEAAADLRSRVADLPVKVVSGMDGLLEIATMPQSQVLVTAIVGMIGIRPTIAAIEAGKDIALANKETLVTAGHIIMPLAAKMGVKILPVDSEHSVMEVKWLFGVDLDQIQVIVHPQSIIHSAVQYVDGAVIAQLGTPDMKLPIQYALFYPDRRPMPGKRLDFYELAQITFEKPDMETFFGLKLAYDAQRIGGSMPTVYNAANEKAVGLFLDRKIAYLQIPELIREAMEQHKVIEDPNVEEILETEASVYDFIEKVYSERQ